MAFFVIVKDLARPFVNTKLGVFDGQAHHGNGSFGFRLFRRSVLQFVLVLVLLGLTASCRTLELRFAVPTAETSPVRVLLCEGKGFVDFVLGGWKSVS